MKSARIVFAAGAALALAACGSHSSTSSSGASASGASPAPGQGPIAALTPGATPKACDILTADIAKKYLGPNAALRRDARPNPHMTQCQYGGDGGVITIMVGPWDMVYTKMGDEKSVSGIGDEAWSSFSGLYVRKGDKGVNVDVIVEGGEFWGKAADDENAKTLAAEEKVAPDIVAKL